MPDSVFSTTAKRWGNLILSPPFLVCTILLAGTAIGLRPGMARIEKIFQKLPIPLRKPLEQFDLSRLTSFRPVSLENDPWLKKDPTQVGTDHVLRAKFAARDHSLPEQPAYLFVTYYSDPKDKVPHTPEVCYRQGATSVEKLTTITIDTPGLAPEWPTLDVRLLLLRQEKASLAILYLFYANGQPCYDREQVRWTIYRPGMRHVYFSKIEAIQGFPHDTDPSGAIACCTRMLQEALPVLIREHYPEDIQLK